MSDPEPQRRRNCRPHGSFCVQQDIDVTFLIQPKRKTKVWKPLMNEKRREMRRHSFN